jgi:bifunctional UDP-N-acetylglucosamine pyrophosphorylase/glucosamine-1-phosphate N-acetyltransferase
MIELAEKENPACVMLTAKVPDPIGYGRILRDSWGNIKAIVEERDAKPEERMISEVNAGLYLFNIETLWPALDKITPNNEQKEYYLTDAISNLYDMEKKILSVKSQDLDEYRGINNRWQLAEITGSLLIKRLKELALSGVTIIDPGSTYIENSVAIEPDVTIYPQTYLAGKMSIGEGSEIGPFVFLNGKKDGITIGKNVKIGPFVRMRPPMTVEDDASVGCFIDLKNTKIGKKSKVPHLSYIGDCTIGENSNIGAGTITCNYDGANKNKTKIGDNVFIGSDTMLVAPVEIGNGAYTGAGSVITKNIPEDALAVERSPMQIKEGWAKKKRQSQKGEEK